MLTTSNVHPTMARGFSVSFVIDQPMPIEPQPVIAVGPSPVAPETLGAWFCPRCSNAFRREDVSAHRCEQDPNQWHHVDAEGRVRHAPNYDGSFPLGLNEHCVECCGADKPTYHFWIAEQSSYPGSGLVTVYAVSRDSKEQPIPLAELEPAEAALYVAQRSADVLVARLA